MLKLVIIIILAALAACTAGFAMMAFVELHLKKGNDVRLFTCYISGENCQDADLKCKDCPVFKNRMDPDKVWDAAEDLAGAPRLRGTDKPEAQPDPDECADALQEEVRRDLQRELSEMDAAPLGIGGEPLLHIQEPPLRTQQPVLYTKEPPIEPEFIDREGARDPGLIRGKEMILCAFKNGACRIRDESGEACRACFYMKDGEILQSGSQKTETK